MLVLANKAELPIELLPLFTTGVPRGLHVEPELEDGSERRGVFGVESAL